MTMPDTAHEAAADVVQAADLTARTLGHDLLGALIDELKVAPDCWQKMSVMQQDATVARLDKRIRDLVAQALRILFAGDHPACIADLNSVTFRDGIRVGLDIARTAEHRHELADRVGQQVVVVMLDAEEYTARMEELRAKAEQQDLFFGGWNLETNIGDKETGEILNPPGP